MSRNEYQLIPSELHTWVYGIARSLSESQLLICRPVVSPVAVFIALIKYFDDCHV